MMPLQAIEQAAQLGQRVRVAQIRRNWSVAEQAGYGGRRMLHGTVGTGPGQVSGRCGGSRQ